MQKNSIWIWSKHLASEEVRSLCVRGTRGKSCIWPLMRRSEAAAFSSAVFVFSGRSGSARRLFSLLRLCRRSQDLGPLFIEWPGLACFFFSLGSEAKYKHSLPLGQHGWQRGLRDKRDVFPLSSLPKGAKKTGSRMFLHLFCMYGVCARSAMQHAFIICYESATVQKYTSWYKEKVNSRSLVIWTDFLFIVHRPSNDKKKKKKWFHPACV